MVWVTFRAAVTETGWVAYRLREMHLRGAGAVVADGGGGARGSQLAGLHRALRAAVASLSTVSADGSAVGRPGRR